MNLSLYTPKAKDILYLKIVDVFLILSFLGASMLLTLMPGPDNLYVVTESISKGTKTGVLISLGLCSGLLVHTTAAALGISLVLQQSSVAFNLMKFFGAGYLFYLALLEYRSNPRLPIDINHSSNIQNPIALWRKGFLMNVLNPKVALFFVALLPQFVSPDGFNITWQMVILGLIFKIQAIILFSLFATFAGRLTPYFQNENYAQGIKWIKVAILVGLALSILILRH